uniref:Ig-like domain-containing protein n=1 Tax=Castor canadensis TaxID=51338 RepID=A0A8C0X3B4_CASCN
ASVQKPFVFPLSNCCNNTALKTLGCLVTGYFPEPVTITWNTNSSNTSTWKFPSITSKWVSESTFTCKVTYEDSIIEAHAQKCTGVSAYLIPPSPLDLYFHKAPKLTCLVVDLENDKVTVTWSRLSKRPVQESSQKVNRYYNATTSITSTLPLVTQDWIEGETYLCTVNYSFLPKPIVRSITKTQGKREIPEIYMFPPPEEKGNQNKLTLTCLIQNFFPKDISVQWLRNKVLIPSNEHSTTVPLNTSGSRTTFFIFSRLEVTRADWMQNNKFTCRVVHEALPEPRTIEKTVSKNPELDLQDLCTEEAESEELDGLWTSTCIFIILFLLSVSYGATVTLLKVKWVFSALLQSTPQALHDYANVLQPRA